MILGTDLPPIDMIALKKRSGVAILVYQEQVILEMIYAIEDELLEAKSQDEVVDLLKSFGYKAMMLRAHPSGEIYRADVLKFADAFAFEPRLVVKD